VASFKLCRPGERVDVQVDDLRDAVCYVAKIEESSAKTEMSEC
jgi:hypothetical protein